MKKNILTIFILSLSVVNLVLTGLIVFTLVPTTNRINNLVGQVASIIDLELESPVETSRPINISVDDMEVYNIENSELTINLKTDADGKQRYVTIDKVSLSLYKDSKDYSKLNSKLADNESIICEFVTNTFMEYTFSEARDNVDAIKENIVNKLKSYYETRDFFVNVTFTNLKFQ